MARFRTKPFEIQAVRWTGDNEGEMQRFAGANFLTIPEDERQYTDDPEATAEVFDKIHSTWILVQTGQWIIRGMKKEFYPCDNEVFESKYEQL